MLDEIPLNAAEFQKAITNQAKELNLLSLNRIVKESEYYNFAYP